MIRLKTILSNPLLEEVAKEFPLANSFWGLKEPARKISLEQGVSRDFACASRLTRLDMRDYLKRRMEERIATRIMKRDYFGLCEIHAGCGWIHQAGIVI